MSIQARRSDVIWNYAGTIVSMASGFVLLPLLICVLSEDQLGLWYVYLAVSNFAMLLEFGFNPTFARNITYVVSGARRLAVKGCDRESVKDGIDWHLLNTVIKAAKVIYGILAVVVLLLLGTLGSAYISIITADMDVVDVWVSWGFFCVSTFLNLYFLWSISVLRGYGDIAGENKAVVIGRLSQLIVTGLLLVSGFGLIGAAIGYLANAVMFRMSAVYIIRQHKQMNEGRKSDSVSVGWSSIIAVFRTIFHIAWKDGIVQLSIYASTQATSIMCSLFLGLSETGMYSILLQFANAVCSFASTYPKSYFPSMQSAFAEGDLGKQRGYVSTGIVGYWILLILGVIGVSVIVLPLLPSSDPNVAIDNGLFFGLCLYLALLQQHSLFCNYIISMNEIPYMLGYIISAFVGIGFVFLLSGVFGMGAWGIIVGQAVPQLIYNNWKWPDYLCKKLGYSYRSCLIEGFRVWAKRISGRVYPSR